MLTVSVATALRFSPINPESDNKASEESSSEKTTPMQKNTSARITHLLNIVCIIVKRLHKVSTFTESK